MGLRQLTLPSVMVETSGGSFAVRGISFDHLFGLFNRHTLLVGELFNLVMTESRKGEIDGDRAAAIVIKMIETAPSVVAEIIALAAGADPSDRDGFAGDVGIARALSVAEQIDALEKIATMTFTSAMPPGKMFALVVKTLGLGTSAKP